MAACVAEESMRLIDSDLERCRPGELELASPAHRSWCPGAARARRSPRPAWAAGSARPAPARRVRPEPGASGSRRN